MGSSNRWPLSAQNSNPGPGMYAFGNDKSKTGGKISGGRAQGKGDKNPGPGSYDPSDRLTRT